MKFQEVILTLQEFWSGQGCILAQPYDVERRRDDEPVDVPARSGAGAVECRLCGALAPPGGPDAMETTRIVSISIISSR